MTNGEEFTLSGPDFEVFFVANEPKLRRALVAAYGTEIGREATADAFSYGWEHWERVSQMANPEGFLYRVGQSKARRHRLRRARLPRIVSRGDPPWIEPRLNQALEGLTLRQRQCVVLVHAMGLTQEQAGSLLGIRPTSVQTHVNRALSKLRTAMKVNHETQQRTS